MARKRSKKSLGEVEETTEKNDKPTKAEVKQAENTGMPLWGVALLMVAVGALGFISGKELAANAANDTPEVPTIKGGGNAADMRAFIANYFLDHSSLTDAQKLKFVGVAQNLEGFELQYAYDYIYNWLAKKQTPASNSPLLAKVKMLNTKYNGFLQGIG